MCTVTYIKKGNKIIIKSNRDEHIDRPLSTAPEKIQVGNQFMIYPRDSKANGTWFVAKNNGTVYVLLNGADKKHPPNLEYARSRGLVLLELASKEDYLVGWNNLNLSNIEPFTVIAVAKKTLVQLRWNGTQKQTLFLDFNMPHIWSSATLYTDEIIKKRKQWFELFLNENKLNLNSNSLWSFHTQTQCEDKENGIIINREQKMLTKNVTQCVIKDNKLNVSHLDLITNQKTIINDEIILA
jgi:hypothetical protein